MHALDWSFGKYQFQRFLTSSIQWYQPIFFKINPWPFNVIPKVKFVKNGVFFSFFWSLGQKLESLLKICDYIMKQEEILIRKMVLQLKFRLMVYKKYMSENHEFCRIWLFYFKISWNILLAMHFSSKLKESLKHLISHFLAIADWILRKFFWYVYVQMWTCEGGDAKPPKI